jgi:hypothetical protein
MSSVAAGGKSWPLYAVPCAVVVALIGMVTVAVQHAQIGQSTFLTVMIVLGFAAALIGAVGGLILANTRRNVMWILAVALSATALLALLATVLSTFGPT